MAVVDPLEGEALGGTAMTAAARARAMMASLPVGWLSFPSLVLAAGAAGASPKREGRCVFVLLCSFLCVRGDDEKEMG